MMQDEDVAYNPSNKKRNIEEMSGQAEPASDRPAKRMYHGYNAMQAISDDHMMRDEAQPIQELDEETSGQINVRFLVYATLANGVVNCRNLTSIS
ncbi:uncharacterized protein FPOAC1_013181 [Fusarium poae]|uniref:uncharacterized protein n=1 Tax=Fusarium poae TaxID=36050 RepID=UPI001D045F2D|nr:uncharacterized protein FPOAC1_013181 [Fusarium poae]KAG8665202.1 hypothetical protein FPOAC1_013181 [Fusarium poae]